MFSYKSLGLLQDSWLYTDDKKLDTESLHVHAGWLLL